MIHVEDQSVRFSPDAIYFPFGNGRLGYDCVSCNAQCCRGHGYSITGSVETQAQVRSNPAIRFFLSPCEGASHLHVTNCAPACFFLTQEGRCRIHEEEGYSAKPGTCRFFPFNDFVRVGHFLVVLPHPSLCPLHITADCSDLSRHDRLLEAMALRGIDPHIATTSFDPAAAFDVIVGERRIVDAAEECRFCDDYVDFAAKQLTLERGLPGEEQSQTVQLREFVASMRQMLAIEERDSKPDTTVTRTLIAVTAILRARSLFKHGRAIAWSDTFEAQARVRSLVALHQLALLARAAGLEAVTYQGVMKLASEFADLTSMLARLSERVRWRPDIIIDPNWLGVPEEREAYERIVRALLGSTRRRDPSTLGEILQENIEGYGLQRVMFLKRLSKRLRGKLEPCATTPSLAMRARFPRSSLQQWALGARVR